MRGEDKFNRRVGVEEFNGVGSFSPAVAWMGGVVWWSRKIR